MLFELINIGVKQYYDTREKTYYLAFRQPLVNVGREFGKMAQFVIKQGGPSSC